MALAARYDRGTQMFDPSIYESGGGYTFRSYPTAATGGGRPNALPMTACINRVGAVATAGDSVALPPAIGGQDVVIVNADPTNAMQIFAAVGTNDSINNAIAATGISLAAGHAIELFSL